MMSLIHEQSNSYSIVQDIPYSRITLTLFTVALPAFLLRRGHLADLEQAGDFLI